MLMAGIAKCPDVPGGTKCSDKPGWQKCGYIQARDCLDDMLVDIWMTTADAATLPGAFSLDDDCYYFDGDTGTPGTIYVPADVTAFDDCETCGNPCENDPDTSCEILRLTYTQTVTTYDNDDVVIGCVGVPTNVTTTPYDVLLYKDVIRPGVWTDIIDSKRNLFLDCPLGWCVEFQFFLAVAGCVTCRATGLNPTGAYAETTCCISVPGNSYLVRTFDISVVCDDVP